MSQTARLSEAQYLERELAAEIRHEYVDGQLFAMAGETKRHKEIVLNVALALRDAMNSLEPDSEQLQILFLPLTTAPDGLAALLDPNRAPSCP